MYLASTAAALTLTVSGAFAQDLKTVDQKTLYSLGAVAAQELRGFNLTPQEVEIVMKGMSDRLNNKALAVDPMAYRAKVQQLAAARRKATGDQQAAAGKV